MAEEEAPPKPASRRPGWVPGLLIVLATVLVLVSTMTTWVRSQALDTDQWVKMSDQLLAEPEVRDALAEYLTNELFTTVDLTGVLESRLPDDLSGLAGPLAGAIRSPATDAVERLLSSDRFKAIWDRANRVAHETLVAVLRSDSRRNLSSSNGEVVLDLGGAVRTIGQDLGVPQAALDRIPDDAGQITILKSDELATAQNTVKVLDFTSWFLFIVVVAMYVLAVFLAVGRRRETLRSVGIALFVGGFTLLAIRAVGIRTSVELFVQDSSNQSLARLVGGVMTELLRQMAWTGLVYGALIVAFAEVLAEHRWAKAVRRFVGGIDNSIAIAATVGIIVVLVWWSPGRAFDRWVSALTLIGGVIAAAIVLIRSGRKERDSDPIGATG